MIDRKIGRQIIDSVAIWKVTSKGFGVRLVILNGSENLKVDSSISGFHNWIDEKNKSLKIRTQ